LPPRPEKKRPVRPVAAPVVSAPTPFPLKRTTMPVPVTAAVPVAMAVPMLGPARLPRTVGSDGSMLGKRKPQAQLHRDVAAAADDNDVSLDDINRMLESFSSGAMEVDPSSASSTDMTVTAPAVRRKIDRSRLGGC
jgi:hypothetical protein